MNRISKTLMLILIAIFVSVGAKSQLTEQVGLRFSAIYYSFNNTKLPGNNGESHFSITLDVIKNTYGSGDIQFIYRAPIIGDGIVEVAKLLKGESGETVGETFLTSLIPGWFQMGYNAYVTENFCVSPGIFLGDLWYTAIAEQQLFSVSPYFNTIEPSGWYGIAGPSVFVDYAPFTNVPLVVHLESAYNFSARFKESSAVVDDDNFDPDSPNPHFLSNRLELRFSSLFTGVHWMKAINRYEATKDINGGSRVEIFLGLQF